MKAKSIAIGNRRIGPEHPVYIVAEMSANHNHSFERAVDILKAAHNAGADAVKVQTYTSDTITLDCDTEDFKIQGTIWHGRRLYDLYQEASMPWEWQPKLKAIADDLDLDFFSTPFDASAVEFLESMQVPAYKIASFEIVDLPLLKRIALTGKPVILSTGMSTQEEISEALVHLRANGCSEVALLKCTSAYPAPPGDANLRTIPDLAERYQCVAGLSDHTLGISVPIAAVSLGASIIEKHFTLSRDDPGPDSAFSLEPNELADLVQSVRTVEAALGAVCYGPTKSDQGNMLFRRSLYAATDIPAGEMLSKDNVRSVRPGYGLHPRYLPKLMGRKIKNTIRRGTPLSWELVEQEGEQS